MTPESEEGLITNAINHLTEKLSDVLLQEFLSLPSELHVNVILIKAAQLLLANVLCQVAATREELQKIADIQKIEMKELIFNCALTGFSDKFDLNKH